MKKSLLIVDDDALIRDVIKSALHNDYYVFEASTYVDAVKFPSRSVDLAIIDYRLPDRDGFAVIQSIRSKNASIPVILMTGYGGEDVAILAIRNNVNDYVKKPLNLKYLRQRISIILGDGKAGVVCELPSDRLSRLEKIAQHIQDNFTEDLSLDLVADIACMSRFSFCRAFKEKFNQRFTTYVNSVRIKHAGELLRNSNSSITEIAFNVGYRHSGHFNRVFKAVHKITPREYRRKMSYHESDTS